MVTVESGRVGYDDFKVISSLAAGLTGLKVDCWATADDTVTVRLINFTTASITKFTPQTLIISGQIVR